MMPLKKALKPFILTAIIILSISFTRELIKATSLLGDSIGKKSLFFILGMLVFFALFQFLKIPTRVYVFGHEIAHVLAIILFGGKIIEFKVRKDGGMVKSDTANAFIALAPYFLPVYMIIIAVIFAIVDAIAKIPATFVYYFLLGITYAFHLACNALYARSYQPDLKEEGLFFSYVVIYAANIVVVTFLLEILSEDFSIIGFYYESLLAIVNGFSAFIQWFTLSG